MPKYNFETLMAMVEAKKISRDSNVKSYDTTEELFADFDID